MGEEVQGGAILPLRRLCPLLAARTPPQKQAATEKQHGTGQGQRAGQGKGQGKGLGAQTLGQGVGEIIGMGAQTL